MKLSELSTDQALDALCEMAPFIDNIANDEDVVSTIGKVMESGKDLNGYGQVMLLMGRIGEVMPLLLKTHRPDVYGILSIMNERDTADIAAQKFTETVRQVKELFQDKDFMVFFRSSTKKEQKESSALSVSAPA